jgi:CRISPR/Cas system-associated endonuclease Cas1
MKKTVTINLLAVLLTAGCSTIPKHASILNEKVSEGIRRNQVETEKIITALADVQRAILDQEWDNLYQKIEQKYMSSKNIADPNSFSDDDRRRIAANAAKTYYDLLGEINLKEYELKLQSRQNAEKLIEINNEISKYLLSLERLDQARNNVLQKLGELTGIDFSKLDGLTKKLIGGI